MLSLNLLNLPVDNFSFTQQPMTGKQIAFSQNIPFPGKLGLQKNIAEQNSIVAEMNYQEQRNQLINQVKETFYHIFFIDKAIKTSENNSQLIKQFIHIAEIRYKVGKGLQQDLLRAQVQFSRISDRLLILKQKRETLTAQMNRLLNRQAGNPMTGAIQLEYQPHTFNLDTLKFLADTNRPLLISWEAALKQSRQKIRLAEKQYLPDFRLAVAYTQREILKNGDPGVDFFSAMMTLNIPLYFWKKQNKQVEESRYNEISIEAPGEAIAELCFIRLSSGSSRLFDFN
jgi:outer membrane protein TolC